MRGWVFKPKTRAAEAATQAPAAGAEGDLEYLRSRDDFDADEMATVHSTGAAASLQANKPVEAPDIDDPGVTRPAIRFHEDLLQHRPAVASPALPAGGGRAGELVLSVKTGVRSTVVSVHDTALIGRYDEEQSLLPELDLSADDAVSRRHARVFRRGGQFWIRDLDSTNGTRLNGSWLAVDTDVPLHCGDLVELGEASELRVLDISFGVELTDEDQQLSELLNEALGVPTPSEESSWPLSAATYGSIEDGVDVLDLALSRSAEAGLLPQDEAEVAPSPPAPQWRLRGTADLELPSFVEPYR
jgi:pSer/pThr/pTyr-binding forkhead associated (FHA) protein